VGQRRVKQKRRARGIRNTKRKMAYIYIYIYKHEKTGRKVK
jgi:hypothetical protein